MTAGAYGQAPAQSVEDFKARLDTRVFQRGGYGPFPEPLGPIFEQAAAQYDVPSELLMALAYLGSAFENRGDQPTIEYGYGVEALRQNDWGGDSLSTAARLLGAPAEAVKVDPRLNITGAAAVLDAYATEAGIDRKAGLDAWLPVVVRYAALADDSSDKIFAGEVFTHLKDGLTIANSLGEKFSIGPQPMIVDPKALLQASTDAGTLLASPAASPPDYSGATWDPAASCNYSTAYDSDDTVIIHTTEGSYAGTISWFKNCASVVSSHYVISEGGAITQMVLENQTAWHVGCLNYRSIGLEHEGFAAAPTHPLAQYDASANLVKDICNRRGIPKAHNSCPPGILGHLDANTCVCGPGHTDPGSGWDWNYFISRVNTLPAQPSGPWTHDSGEFNPTQTTGSWTSWTPTSGTCTGVTCWWATSPTTPELYANWDIQRLNWNFRGRYRFDAFIPCTNATVGTKYRFQGWGYNPTASNPDNNRVLTEGCDQVLFAGWQKVSERDWTSSRPGGVNVGTNDYYATLSGDNQMGVSKARWYGHKWEYINDWTCLGGFSSPAVSTAHGFDEASLYLYPAADTTHGNVFAIAGETPGRVQTGDCNWANSLDFKGNASAYGGGDNMDSYGFCWIYAPSGAGPKFLIGSDDGNRVWVNGALINDTNASRALTRDQDETTAVSLPAGWSRVLFKIHNITGGFQGTISLRNGNYRSYNEPSVNLQTINGVKSFGLAGEQDSWYPRITVTSFYGGSNPAANANYYGNNTTVTASGTAAGSGPVPFWKVMQFQWGYGLSGDTNYADVSSSGTAWSHTQANVTGHRRFHFFAVSSSRRTSFQSGTGSGDGSGGLWNWGNTNGVANYMDVFIDNAAPQAPSFTSATASSPSQIDLNWAIPNDQGVGVGPGPDEYASEGADNAYRRGDVGVLVKADGGTLYGWGTNTSASHSGLQPNTPHTYTISARDNTSGGRGSWNNATADTGAVTVWTLSNPPGPQSLTPDKMLVCAGATILWTAPDGFGPGTVAQYRYVWDQAPTHTWEGTESSWSGGMLPIQTSAAGTWYLHVEGLNGDGLPNGTYDYPVTVNPRSPADFNADCAVDTADLDEFMACMSGPAVLYEPYNPPLGCTLNPDDESILPADFDRDGDIDQDDFGVLQRCLSGAGQMADPNCGG